MFFKKQRANPVEVDAPAQSEVQGHQATAAQSPRRSTAETAHLVGPGCVKLVGQMPIWKPVEGARLQLHPEYLRRVYCYGNVDFSTAVLRLLWRKGAHVAFLSSSGHALLGKLQPAGAAPNLPRLQHLAAENQPFRLALAQDLVRAKIESQAAAARYYQQQGKGAAAGRTLQDLNRHRKACDAVDSVVALRGVEGSATAIWFRFFASLVPVEWGFRKRVARPATDPVNALLSLGYAFAHHRCDALLSAADLDPRVGFLHDVRPGRSSLACDLVEPLRAPLVDRMVLGMLARRSIRPESFQRDGAAYRLQSTDFKRYLAAFEQALTDGKPEPSFHQQTLDRIEDWSQRIRRFATQNGGSSTC